MQSRNNRTKAYVKRSMYIHTEFICSSSKILPSFLGHVSAIDMIASETTAAAILYYTIKLFLCH